MKDFKTEAALQVMRAVYCIVAVFKHKDTSDGTNNVEGQKVVAFNLLLTVFIFPETFLQRKNVKNRYPFGEL